MFIPNDLKKRVAENEPSLGVWLGLTDPAIAEMVGHAGYDFCIIDLEHGLADMKDAVNMMRALAAFRTTAMIRVPGHDLNFIARIIDAGAQTLMIPMVETADQARAIVSACRYPPLGRRGFAATIVRASGYGNATEYRDRVADEMFLALQIETVKGVDNAAEIAAVDGVDMIFIGAADLSGSLRILPEIGRQEVTDEISRCVEAVKPTGTALGTIPRPGRGNVELLEDGFIAVTGGSDIGFFRMAANSEVDAFQEKIKA